MTWFESPQYLKGMQKLRNIDPSKRAIIQTLIDELGGLYAGEDMQKQLQAQRIALQGEVQDKSLELGEKDVALSRKNLKYMKKSGKTAEALGYADIGISGLAGYADMRRKQQETDFYKSLIDRYSKA